VLLTPETRRDPEGRRHGARLRAASPIHVRSVPMNRPRRFLPLAACVAALRVRILLAALLSAFAVCSAAHGQSVNYTTGSIAGKVSDDTGAGVPGVAVTATNLETGLTRTAYSNKDGGYEL